MTLAVSQRLLVMGRLGVLRRTALRLQATSSCSCDLQLALQRWQLCSASKPFSAKAGDDDGGKLNDVIQQCISVNCTFHTGRNTTLQAKRPLGQIEARGVVGLNNSSQVCHPVFLGTGYLTEVHQ